ncbi:hypothetical protein AAHC03_013533 [Spirometra sp. Aus1]
MQYSSFSANVTKGVSEFNQSLSTIGGASFAFFIHPFWKQFDLNKPIIKAAFGTAIGLISLSAAIGNGIVVGVFLSSKCLRTPPNIFIISLAISDMAFSLIMGFPLKTISSFIGYWNWGQLGCELYGFSGGLFGFASLTTVVMIAIDRYLVIAHPIKSAARVSNRRALLMVAFAWSWSLFWSSPPFYGFGRYIPDGFQTSCSFDYLADNVKNYLFVAGMYIFGFLIPVGIFLFAYVQIMLVVKGNERNIANLARSFDSENPNCMRLCKLSAYS